jgi:bleomycin hydrolase
MKTLVLTAAVISCSHSISAQVTRDRGQFREQKAGYYQNSILRGIEEYEQAHDPKKKEQIFKIDPSTVNAPKSIEEFTTWWKQEPVSQGNTGTCWSYSTTSFFETEVYRLHKQQIKLSEMYTAYWEYVEKARRFVQERGNSHFDEGSEANAVVRIYKMYGIVPLEAYSGLKSGQSYHNHSIMAKEMKNYLTGIKEAHAWNEEEVLATIKSIMNHYMGTPPTKVKVNGKEMSPQDYLKNVVKLNMEDYIDALSMMQQPYWEKVEYEVPDNWWHSKEYYNVPLDDYMNLVKNAIKEGYTMMIGGDVSEAGFDSYNNIAVIPTFDIPAEYIDESARQFRFSNKTTTDDHGMHLAGYTIKDGVWWFLLKDSGAGSRNCGKDSKNFGYYFMREEYVKLKMMTVLVHKDMMKELMKRFKV